MIQTGRHANDNQDPESLCGRRLEEMKSRFRRLLVRAAAAGRTGEADDRRVPG